jgi:hypothetical protein
MLESELRSLNIQMHAVSFGGGTSDRLADEKPCTVA